MDDNTKYKGLQNVLIDWRLWMWSNTYYSEVNVLN